jgi:hypothetical protein
MGQKLGVFLRNRRLQRLPAVLEVPGEDGHGPNADEVRKAKKLHAAKPRAAKTNAKKPSRSSRSRSRKAQS